jgi:hypothetical protein
MSKRRSSGTSAFTRADVHQDPCLRHQLMIDASSPPTVAGVAANTLM